MNKLILHLISLFIFQIILLNTMHAQDNGNCELVLKNGSVLKGERISLDSAGNVFIYFSNGTFYKDKIENVEKINSSKSNEKKYNPSSGTRDNDIDSGSKHRFSILGDYQPNLGGSSTMLGIRGTYNLIYVTSFNLGIGLAYHRMKDFLPDHVLSPAGYPYFTITKSSPDLNLLAALLSFRYILRYGKIQKYIEGSIGYEYQLLKVHEGSSSSDEASNSWYSNPNTYYYSYIFHLSTHVEYKEISSFKISYGFRTEINEHASSFFDIGIANYRGTYSIQQNRSITYTSGTPPPAGINPYYPYYYSSPRNGIESINELFLNFSFGIEF